MHATSVEMSGAVAAGHDAVARVGAGVLEDGGNAVDAVVAMMLAGSVCEGTLTGIGGGGFMIVGGGGSLDEPVLLDFFTRQPGLEQRPWLAPWESFTLELGSASLSYGTGPASVAVPGVVGGIAHATERFGRLALPRLAKPAMELAQEGVALTRTQAGEHSSNGGVLVQSAEGAAIFLDPSGRFREEGELFRQPSLAAAIEEIAATGAESFYRGGIAARLVQWSDERGGRISARDLAEFRVIEREPLALRIGDMCMYANPAPAMGGSGVARLLEAMLADVAGHESRDVRIGRALVEVIEAIDPPRTRQPMAGEPVTVQAAETLPPSATGDPSFARSPSTTHVSAIDSDGMVAGATCTVGYGSGEFIPGTGVQLNNMLAEYDHTIVRPAGTTVPSMMTPSILSTPRTMVQIGSAGSDRIPHAISQVLERMWRGDSLEEAVVAPRISFDGTTVHVEPGIDERAVELLAERHPVQRWEIPDPYFGTVNGTARPARGGAVAVGDPRRQCTGIVV